MLNKAMRGLLVLLLTALAVSALAQSANPRYVIQGASVYDKKTDLTWSQCSLGQKWTEGIGCVGVVKKYSRDQVMSFILENGWRVPDREELMTLVDQKRKVAKQWPMLDVAAFPDSDEAEWYWTTTPDGDDGWRLNFVAGEAYFSARFNLGSVLLVRSGK